MKAVVGMNSKLRLNLVLASVCTASMAALSAILYPWLQNFAMDEVKSASQHQMATAQAVRAYTTDHIRALLLRDQSTFHAESVPSFAATQTMKYLQDIYPGYKYEEVALNPTNPRSKAANWQIEIINSFRAGKASESFHTTGSGASATLHYAKPLKVSSAACLNCHGRPEVAPLSLLAKYGKAGGFGWREGEIIGAQVVSVSAADAVHKADAAFTLYLLISGGAFALFFLVLNWMLSRTVLRPIQSNNESLKRMAEEDALTGAANRRGFNVRVDHEVNNAHAINGIVSIVVLDLDHFKRVNDVYGHAGGDLVLKVVCERIAKKIRRSDLLGRLGGEEFAVLLPCTDETGARRLAENLRAAIEEEAISGVGLVTASFGVAQLDIGSNETSEAWLARADAALYAAKEAGRNRVRCASSIGTTQAQA
jgi:two-component system cell cycle response regulator